MLSIAIPEPTVAFTGMPGYVELIVVALIVLLLFGNRLPSVMRSLGLSITEFKKGMHDVTSDDDEDERIEEERKEPAEKV